MHTEHNVSKTIAVFITATLLLNAMAPTLAHAEQDRLQAAIQTLNHKSVTVMVRGQIDSSKITKGWYAHVVHTSQETTSGRIVNKTASGIIMLQHKQQDGKIAYNNINIAQNNIAYDNIDTLLVAQNMRDIERYRELGAKYDARVRFQSAFNLKKVENWQAHQCDTRRAYCRSWTHTSSDAPFFNFQS